MTQHPELSAGRAWPPPSDGVHPPVSTPWLRRVVAFAFVITACFSLAACSAGHPEPEPAKLDAARLDAIIECERACKTEAQATTNCHCAGIMSLQIEECTPSSDSDLFCLDRLAVEWTQCERQCR